MRRLAMIALVLSIGACTNGKELPMVNDTDPVWALVSDRISAAEMPR